ncbi:hypothetical protein [Thermopolyspora flexuosa]|uniref:hypothetical protein n=1 Tax=Thermopolyspora flexuosa TaxID=103836 RepID=UPI0011528E2C|nr:hypothetical protein [Thermopolyspora flexuosa]
MAGKTLKARIRGSLDRADRSLCIDQDWWAHRLGWQVSRTGFGARRYRDPRFDLLRHIRGEVDGGVRA